MLSNYLKTALRSLKRHTSYTLINVVGLAVGMALCLLISLFVLDELSYDRYHGKSDRLYRLALKIEGSTVGEGLAKVADLWGPGAKAALPEVEDATRFVFHGRTLVERGSDRQYESNGLYADSTTLQMFDWTLEAGDAASALVGPARMVVTRSFADRWFSGEDPVGQTLTIDGDRVYTVTGVVQDVPSNSHFTFDFLVSLETYVHENRGDWVRWNQFYTYLLLARGADPIAVEAKFDGVLDRHLEAEYAEAYYPLLQPISSIHLESNLHREMAANADIGYVYIFSAIALFILLVAGTNFVSLSTARSSKRAQEVGVRKASGADRGMLILQFLGESILLSVLSAGLALGLAAALLEPFNVLAAKSLSVKQLFQPGLVLAVFGGSLIVGFLAGIYPAFVLSAFKPASVLKGDFATGNRGRLRKGLVVFQFAVSTFLIVATGVVYTQLRFIEQRDLGFSKDQLVVVSTNLSETRTRFEAVKAQLKSHPDITSVSFTGNQPGGSDWGLPMEIEGFDDENAGFDGFRVHNVDWDFLETYQVGLVDGRGFSRDFAADSANYLINEAAARQLGWTLDSASRIGSPRTSRPFGDVVGIVEDFHFRSLHEPIAPLLIMMQNDWSNSFSIKLAPGSTDLALAHIESVMAAWEPAFPLTYRFFDQQFESLHDAEQRAGSLLTYFAVLAILIACLGLFGLSSFTAEQRTKEIGVRKVLGASSGRILAILSSDIAKLVFTGSVLAVPLAWYAMGEWLEQFAYAVEIRWYVPAGAVLATLTIAILSVSYQSIKASLADPIRSLRYE